VIWLVGMANAINWIDLMVCRRGVWNCCCHAVNRHTVYATTSSSTDCSSIGWWSIDLVNFNPAQIFMGDAGLFYGIHLGWRVIAGKSAAVTAVLLPYLILAVPIVDMSAVILARLRHGKSPLSQTPFASPVITGWSVTKIGGLFHLL